MKVSPLCLRLPPDLRAAIASAAEASGLTLSEWVRDMLHRIIYNEPPGIEAGYMQGRALGFTLTRSVLLEALGEAAQTVPTSLEEGMARIQRGVPHHVRRHDDD
jgi:hypothetical protein